MRRPAPRVSVVDNHMSAKKFTIYIRAMASAVPASEVTDPPKAVDQHISEKDELTDCRNFPPSRWQSLVLFASSEGEAV